MLKYFNSIISVCEVRALNNITDTEKKAKKQLFRLGFYTKVIAALSLVLLLAGCYFLDTLTFCLLVLGTVLFYLYSKRFLLKKYFYSTILDKLDAETFRVIVYKGRFASWCPHSDYYCGNYARTAEICRYCLNSTKKHSIGVAHFYVALARIYFDIGNKECLRAVLGDFHVFLSTLKTSKQKKILRLYPVMPLYEAYANGDVQACFDYFNSVPTDSEISRVARAYASARVALLEGHEQDAITILESLAREVQQLNYGKLSALVLSKLDSGMPLGEAFQLSELLNEEVDISDVIAFYKRSKKQKVERIILSVLVYVLLMCCAFKLIDMRIDAVYDRMLTELVQETYGNVEIIEFFVLEKDGELVDDMFICKDEREVTVGCFYSLEGDSQNYCFAFITVPTDVLLEDRGFPFVTYFPAGVSDNTVYCSFYLEKSELPDSYYHLTEFELNGITVYFVITKVI